MIQFEANSNSLYHIFRRACDLNDKRLLFLLIETFKTNHTLENILLKAIGHDDIKVMDFILSGAKDDIDIDYEIDGFNPLLKAVNNGSFLSVDLLLKNEANINYQNENKYTPLMAASGFGISGMVHHFLKKGADPFIRDKEGITALMLAASNSSKSTSEILKYIYYNKRDRLKEYVNLTRADGATALMIATSNAEKLIVQMLIDADADINHADKDGNTAIIVASEFDDCCESIRVLIEKGADLEHKNIHGKTALDYAKEFNNIDLVELIEEYTEKIAFY